MLEATIPLNDFMDRFGDEFFEAAMNRSKPEYSGGREDLGQQIANARFRRTPFPAQGEAVKAIYSHLYEFDAKMAFAVGEMGTGKTTVASMIGSMPKTPQRIIVTVPPHLVSKWAREINTINPNAKVIKINSGGANRILEQAAAANPGRPEQTEFYVIGRVRLRMDYRIQSAMNARPSLSGLTRFHCPCCGHMPVEKATLKQDEELPAEAIIESKDSEEDESDTDGNMYLNVQPSQISRVSKCETVVDANGVIQPGCKSTLWQARRNHEGSRQRNLIKGFQKLPGVGAKLAERLANAPGGWEAAESLENGDMPSLLWRALGPIRRKAIQRWLDKNEFSLDANDFAPVRFIHKRLPRQWFDLAMFDEVHELKGQASAQGMAYGVLAGVVRKVLCLTGTLIDGYAASLHPLLFRADPQRMIEAGYGADDAARFQWELGVIKEICIETETSELKSSRGRKQVKRQKKNLPGLHPEVVTNLLLPNTIFLTLSDIEASIQSLQSADEEPVRLLPSYSEVYVAPDMDPHQATAVETATAELMDMLKKALARGGGKSMLSPIISSVLRYPDDCFRPLCVKTRHNPDPLFEAAPVEPPEQGYFPKVRFAQDLVKREMSEGRRTVIYTTYTGRRDMTTHYAQALEEVGADVRILRSTVPTDQREEWIEQQVKTGADVVICNPELVKTGLDLFDFPTMLFMQTGYVTDTILQAARRSWRIGQQEPVRVYFAGYEDSEAQKAALRLMAKKIRVANQAKGDVSDSGLSVLDDDDEASAMQAMANAILDRKRDRTHDTITGAIKTVDEDDRSKEHRANSLAELNRVMERAQIQADDDCADQQPVMDADVHDASAMDEFTAADDPSIVTDAVNDPAPDTEESARRSVLIAVKKSGRKQHNDAQRVATDQVPAGAQFALF